VVRDNFIAFSFRIIFVTALLINLSSCNSDRVRTSEKSNHGDELDSIEAPSLSRLGFLGKSLVYSYSNDSLNQTLTIKALTEDTLKFDYTVKNSMHNIQKKYSGIAVSNKMGVEVGCCDEKGNMLSMKTYIYSDSCWLSFSFEYKNFRFASIDIADCIDTTSKVLSFKSIEFLQLK
jgi:hypothetical protein